MDELLRFVKRTFDELALVYDIEDYSGKEIPHFVIDLVSESHQLKVTVYADQIDLMAKRGKPIAIGLSHDFEFNTEGGWSIPKVKKEFLKTLVRFL